MIFIPLLCSREWGPVPSSASGRTGDDMETVRKQITHSNKTCKFYNFIIRCNKLMWAMTSIEWELISNLKKKKKPTSFIITNHSLFQFLVSNGGKPAQSQHVGSHICSHMSRHITTCLWPNLVNHVVSWRGGWSSLRQEICQASDRSYPNRVFLCLNLTRTWAQKTEPQKC